MFQYVHHVHYVVENRETMVEYLEKNFGLNPDRLEINHNGKEAQYHVGKTEIQITEPLDSKSSIGQHLAQHGPGVFHIAWGVENLQQVAQQLTAKGIKIRGKEPIIKTKGGYSICNIDPASSHGL